MTASLMTAALLICRFCETVLVGAETNICDPCLDELCAACRENLVEFHTPGLPAQLCNGCHDDWIEWNDPKLPDVPFESDLQESRERFVRFTQAKEAKERP